MLVDDDPIFCAAVAAWMETEEFQLRLAHDGVQAFEAISANRPQMLLLDYQLPDATGLDVLSRTRSLLPETAAILLTAHASVELAVRAMRAGVLDVMTKPVDPKKLLDLIRLTFNRQAAAELTRQSSKQISQSSSNNALQSAMGPSTVITSLSANVEKVAGTRFNVLIMGETGTGKELVARALHGQSTKASGPFVAVDCGALPEQLLESELFGHEKGAFTGAGQRKLGKFELARGGTLFLDEISNLTWSAQASLLRAIQERVIVRVGGNDLIPVDARIIAACNRDIAELVDRGAFRQDLYFRLCEFALRTAPLRERVDDILFLARRFLAETNVELGKHIVGISAAAAELLLSHSWPGNVRELRNLIRQAVLQADDVIDTAHLNMDRRCQGSDRRSVSLPWEGYEERRSGGPDRRRSTPPAEDAEGAAPDLSLRAIVRRHTAALERELVVHAMGCSHGNKQRAAQILSVDYKTLLTKVKEYAITEKDWSQRPDYRGFLETLRIGAPVNLAPG